MPAHKGVSLLGCEPYDLTEVKGADELFAPEGIIAESEKNAGTLFGCDTAYSAEGSSLCIRAMLRLAVQHAAERGRKPAIAAARNVHRAFLTAAVLLGFDIIWLTSPDTDSYLRSAVTAEDAENILAAQEPKPIAVYLTSPDYLGHTADIRAFAQFCHKNDMLLLVDNAHGAYLRFMTEDTHPITLGADLCCDSAHKTLPVLTGGAYLHLSHNAPASFRGRVKQAMGLFASTSPSYLILQSLDRCNALLAGNLPQILRESAAQTAQCRANLAAHGYELCGDEPMKLTICPKSYGYTGTALADILRSNGFEPEFSDPDYLVLMPSPFLPQNALSRLADCLCTLPRLNPITEQLLKIPAPQPIMSPRDAMLRSSECLPLDLCIGRICAELTVSCPPAVPVILCGERISQQAADAMRRCGYTHCTVI